MSHAWTLLIWTELAEARELADDDLADASYDDALGHAQYLIGELTAIIDRRDVTQIAEESAVDDGDG